MLVRDANDDPRSFEHSRLHLRLHGLIIARTLRHTDVAMTLGVLLCPHGPALITFKGCANGLGRSGSMGSVSRTSLPISAYVAWWAPWRLSTTWSTDVRS